MISHRHGQKGESLLSWDVLACRAAVQVLGNTDLHDRYADTMAIGFELSPPLRHGHMRGRFGQNVKFRKFRLCR